MTSRHETGKQKEILKKEERQTLVTLAPHSYIR
jgi:hypothetical protein